VFEHPVISVETHEVHAHGRSETHVRVHRPDVVVVVPITEMGEVILVEQHRTGIDGPSLEPPGGRVDPGEHELAAAKRELKEETGYSGGMWETLGWAPADAALMTNRIWMFAAHGVTPMGAPSVGVFEQVIVHRVPLDDLRELIVSGRIHHGPALLALQRVLLVERALDEASAL
jgi:8-oxo-dGTP pyrophosphatase MutT (NUDIX family)